MAAPRKFRISSSEIACAYGCTRQNANVLVRKYGIDTVSNPELLFAAVLECNAGQLRRRLSDPSFRKQAAVSLGGAAFRDAIREGLKKANREDPL